jgi:hypothetical protein
MAIAVATTVMKNGKSSKKSTCGSYPYQPHSSETQGPTAADRHSAVRTATRTCLPCR